MDYIARVELHNATYDDYENLHASMQKNGYSRQIVGDNRQTYQLPTGTYIARNTNATLQVAINAAKGAANDTGKASAVIVAAWSSALWDGLSLT